LGVEAALEVEAAAGVVALALVVQVADQAEAAELEVGAVQVAAALAAEEVEQALGEEQVRVDREMARAQVAEVLLEVVAGRVVRVDQVADRAEAEDLEPGAVVRAVADPVVRDQAVGGEQAPVDRGVARAQVEAVLEEVVVAPEGEVAVAVWGRVAVDLVAEAPAAPEAGVRAVVRDLEVVAEGERA
jgi:hypothetical protein